MKIRVQPSKQQLDGASFFVERNEGIACYATGSGKSLLSILASFRLIVDGKISKAIFFCTKSSCDEVENEFIKWTDMTAISVDTWQEFGDAMEGCHSLIIVQYHKFVSWLIGREVGEDDEVEWKWGPNVDNLKDLFARHQTAVFFDECHTLKTTKSVLGTVFRAIRPLFKRCYGITATLVSANIWDLYNTVDFFKKGCLGTPQEFEARYLVIDVKTIRARGRKIQIREVVSFKNLDLLEAKLKEVVISYFPDYDINFEPIFGELENQTQYLEAAKGVFESEDGRVKQHSTRLFDLQEVVNSDRGKHRALMEALKRTSHEGVIIFCSYYKSIDQVYEILDLCRLEYKEISGKIDDRKGVKEWFCKDPRNKVLVITRAGGQSLNLQVTPHIILFDTPFGIGPFQQIIGRVVRQYSLHKAFNVMFIVLKGTIDEYKYELLAGNKELLKRLLSNELVPPSERLVDFNARIVTRLKNSMLWRRK